MKNPCIYNFNVYICTEVLVKQFLKSSWNEKFNEHTTPTAATSTDVWMGKLCLSLFIEKVLRLDIEDPIRKSGVFVFWNNWVFRRWLYGRALEARVRWFESSYPDKTGSKTVTNREVSEWLKLPALETGDGTRDVLSVGSNPTFPTYGDCRGIGRLAWLWIRRPCGFKSRLSPQGGFAK